MSESSDSGISDVIFLDDEESLLLAKKCLKNDESLEAAIINYKEEMKQAECEKRKDAGRKRKRSPSQQEGSKFKWPFNKYHPRSSSEEEVIRL